MYFAPAQRNSIGPTQASVTKQQEHQTVGPGRFAKFFKLTSREGLSTAFRTFAGPAFQPHRVFQHQLTIHCVCKDAMQDCHIKRQATPAARTLPLQNLMHPPNFEFLDQPLRDLGQAKGAAFREEYYKRIERLLVPQPSGTAEFSNRDALRALGLEGTKQILPRGRRWVLRFFSVSRNTG